jgi:predicted outer membrane repeat protein
VTCNISSWADLKAATSNASGTFVLTGQAFHNNYTSEIRIASGTNVTVIGNGAVVDATTKGRFFVVNGALTLQSLIMTHGKVGADQAIANGGGGAIWSNGDLLTILNCTVTSNVAHRYTCSFNGGALYISGGHVAIAMSIFARNKATNGKGGAIYLAPRSSARVDASTFESNYADNYCVAYGGAICCDNATLMASNTNFTASREFYSYAYGGALSVKAGGLLILVQCTFSFFSTAHVSIFCHLLVSSILLVH